MLFEALFLEKYGYGNNAKKYSNLSFLYIKMTSLNTWIGIKIEDGDIKYFSFSNIKEIGKGAFGIVYKANWDDSKIQVALKSPLNNSTIDENQKENFLNEVNIN